MPDSPWNVAYVLTFSHIFSQESPIAPMDEALEVPLVGFSSYANHGDMVYINSVIINDMNNYRSIIDRNSYKWVSTIYNRLLLYQYFSIIFNGYQ